MATSKHTDRIGTKSNDQPKYCDGNITNTGWLIFDAPIHAIGG